METHDKHTAEYEKDDYLNNELLVECENCRIDSLKPTPELLQALSGDWVEDFG